MAFPLKVLVKKKEEKASIFATESMPSLLYGFVMGRTFIRGQSYLIHLADIGQGKGLVMVQDPLDSPFVLEEEDVPVPIVLHKLGVGGDIEIVQVHIFRFYPSGIAEGKAVNLDLDPVLVLQSEFEDLHLQRTDNPHDDLFHPDVEFPVNLDGSFLGNLGDAFDKLLPLDRIQGFDPGKMFRGECRDSFKPELLVQGGQGVADGVDPRVKDADDISRIGFLHDFPFLG